jgi:putative transposase
MDMVIVEVSQSLKGMEGVVRTLSGVCFQRGLPGTIDLPPPSRASLKLVKSVNQPENGGYEEEQKIIGFLRQAEAGMPIKELCRNGGFSDATFYKWRAKFGGMQISEAQRLRELESENAKLKRRRLAEAHLDMHALKSVLGVKR